MRSVPLLLALILSAAPSAPVLADPGAARAAELCDELPAPHRADCQAAYDLLTSGPLSPEADLSVRPFAQAGALRHRYDTASMDDCAVAGPLRLPAGAAVRILVTSHDTIYAWRVPSLGIAVDLVPGRINEVTIETAEPGLHEGHLLRDGESEGAPAPVEIVHAQAFAGWERDALPGLCRG